MTLSSYTVNLANIGMLRLFSNRANRSKVLYLYKVIPFTIFSHRLYCLW